MFPVSLDLDLLKVAVAGSGSAARQRIRLLIEAGAGDFAVYAPDADADMVEAAGTRLVNHLPEDSDLDALDVLFIADLAESDEARLAAAARARKVLVNTEDVRPLCDFHVPAMVRRGDLLLAISTGGASPGLARRLKAYLGQAFGEEWADHINEIASARTRWREEGVPLPELGKRTNALIDEKGLAVMTALQATTTEQATPVQRQAMDSETVTSARLEQLRRDFGHLEGAELLDAMVHKAFPDKIAMVSSFGSEAVVLLHLLSEVNPTVPVLFLNTGKLFGETLRYRDRLQDKLGLTDVRSLGPDPRVEAVSDPAGDLWARDADGCCHFRKVLPLAHGLKGFEASITGRKQFQTGARASMPTIEQEANTDGTPGRFKINPLANWNLDDLKTYIEDHKLPRHPLVKDGYLSIGCMPCTDRVKEGEDYRSGRWAGTDKDECGIHVPGLVDGDGI